MTRRNWPERWHRTIDELIIRVVWPVMVLAVFVFAIIGVLCMVIGGNR